MVGRKTSDTVRWCPVRACCRLLLADADKASRRDGTDFLVWSQVRIRVKCKISGNVFIAERESLTTQRERSEMTAPQQAFGVWIVEKRLDADIVPSQNELSLLWTPDR